MNASLRARPIRRPGLSGRHGGSTIEISPGVEWIDRITGRAAVDPAYRELLFTKPALALTGEPLPAGLLAALRQIHARDLFEYARLAIAAMEAHLASVEPRRGGEPLELPLEADLSVAWAAA